MMGQDDRASHGKTGTQEYFKNIHDAVATTLKGMAITWRNLIRAPVTVQYPNAEIKGTSASQWARDYFPEMAGSSARADLLSPMAARYRGFLFVDTPSCISCRICELACPIDCIVIEDVKTQKRTVKAMDGTDTTKLRDPVRFDIDLAKCMFCGLCVEPCPTGSIYFTKEFEGAQADIHKLLFRFVDEAEAGDVRSRVPAVPPKAPPPATISPQTPPQQVTTPS